MFDRAFGHQNSRGKSLAPSLYTILLLSDRPLREIVFDTCGVGPREKMPIFVEQRKYPRFRIPCRVHGYDWSTIITGALSSQSEKPLHDVSPSGNAKIRTPRSSSFALQASNASELDLHPACVSSVTARLLRALPASASASSARMSASGGRGASWPISLITQLRMRWTRAASRMNRRSLGFSSLRSSPIGWRNLTLGYVRDGGLGKSRADGVRLRKAASCRNFVNVGCALPETQALTVSTGTWRSAATCPSE